MFFCTMKIVILSMETNRIERKKIIRVPECKNFKTKFLENNQANVNLSLAYTYVVFE
jgi:hypothetical protein